VLVAVIRICLFESMVMAACFPWEIATETDFRALGASGPLTLTRIQVTRKQMTRKPLPRVMAVPLSSMSELRDILEPFLGAGGTRGNVVMVRLADEALSRLDQLVEAGLFGSRSEAAAFLVGAGIRAQQPLLERIAEQTAAIGKMRKELRQTALETLQKTAAARPPKGRK
jgi:Arc/MetJ-type ribon-helix-helix transcriptional regulator